jgi:glucose-1-phosphate adenylyltransferase
LTQTIQCLAMLLAGGEGRRLAPFTSELAKPAVPFGDRLRLIDFPLYNCFQSGIDTIGILTQYCADSIHAYVEDNDAYRQAASSAGRITMLPSWQTSPDGYAGTADALYRNIAYVDQHAPEHVLILSGDHIYQMDYQPMLESHIRSDASATIAVKPVAWREASRFGILHTDEQQRITTFEEKPANPQSNLASMGIYLFRWADLKRYLLADAANPSSSHDFGKDLIPALLAAQEKLSAYPFEGYWRDVGTIDSLWDANMDLLDGAMKQDNNWGMLSESSNGNKLQQRNAVISQSLVHANCIVEAKIDRSVIGASVTIGRGSEISESIIMPGATIGRNVKIHRAIIGENAVIADGFIIGESHNEIAVVGPNEVVGVVRRDNKPASAAAAS